MKKRILFSMFLAVMMLFSVSGFSAAQAKPAAVQPAADQPFVPGELVVGFDPGQAPGDLTAQADTVASSVGATVLKAGFGGMSVLKVPDGADVNALTASLKNMKGVRYVEPNYIVKLIDPAVDQKKVPDTSYVIRSAKSKDGKATRKMGYPVAGLKAAKTKTGAVVSATYPNDPSVWTNWGWSNVGADIVWNNTTASKNVCVIDTGVDYKHPDLAGKVIKGFDFVNYDFDPMDDYGHGTHVAGIIAAVSNNKQGMVGVSTGKVVAVKVLDANGNGTNYDVAQGIWYCADRPDVNILSLSLGGGDPSNTLKSAVNYAVNTKGKLLVAAAGNDSSNTPDYPAAYVLNWPDKVMAVGASGQWWSDDSGNEYFDNSCQAYYSNYGSWVKFVAPGTDIYSTTPWDKPFTLNNWDDIPTRYAYLSGTSMATPFVSAVAARAWGYKPSWSNSDIESWLYDNGSELDTDPGDGCWDSSMSDARLVNVAASLERGAITLSGLDANTDLPLIGATVTAYWGGALKGTAVITPKTTVDPATLKVTNTWFTSWADIINLPTPFGLALGYLPKINATNYTASAQTAFTSWAYTGVNTSNGVTWTWGGYWGPAWAVVPQKSANFAVVGEALDTDTSPELVGWLPTGHPFVVNPDYYEPFGSPDVAPFGSMSQQPFARWLNFDWHYQSLIIRNRSTATALPYWPGTYQFGMRDSADTGSGNQLDYDNAAAFIWKDGVIKYRVDKPGSCGPGYHWWLPFTINSSASGSPFYSVPTYNCSSVPLY